MVTLLTGTKVASEVVVQPTIERGISNAVIIAAYFLTPALMALMKKRNIFGSSLLKSFDIHKLSQTRVLDDQLAVQSIKLPNQI